MLATHAPEHFIRLIRRAKTDEQVQQIQNDATPYALLGWNHGQTAWVCEAAAQRKAQIRRRDAVLQLVGFVGFLALVFLCWGLA